jgi:FkbM family methyltransferase
MATLARFSRPLRKFTLRTLERLLRARIYREDPYASFLPALARGSGGAPDTVVFDVGANDGRTVVQLRHHLPHARIYAFEPVAATFAQLRARVEGDPLTTCLPLGLGEESGKAVIHVGKQASASSLHAAWAPSTHEETIELSTVDAIMRREGIRRLRFLKIDTEGFEQQVLRGARAALAAGAIDFLQAEVRFDWTPPGADGRPDGTSHLESLHAILQPFGYRVHGFYNLCRQTLRPGFPGPLAYCDVIFVRPLETPNPSAAAPEAAARPQPVALQPA